MRKTLFVLKGRPSTSPFCTWINEPLNPRSCRPTGGLLPNRHPYQTIRHSDQQSTSTYTVFAVTVVTMLLPAPGEPESIRAKV